MYYSAHSVILCFIAPITNIESCLTYNELSEIKQCKRVKNDIKAYVLMLKLVYPCASKTFKVLSYCAVRMHGHKL